MKKQTILQKIIDALEAAGIGVSGAETWPPEEDGRVSANLTIRPRPESETDDVDTFIDTFLVYDTKNCESADRVYGLYTSTEPRHKLSKPEFIRAVIDHFGMDGKEVVFQQCYTLENKSDYCFFNIRFSHYNVDQRTDAALDIINAAKAPGDPPVIRDPCADCGTHSCEDCSVKSGTPIKLYTPEEAVSAMLRGRVLWNKNGTKFYWKDRHGDGAGFWIDGPSGCYSYAGNLSGLYEEARYV
jgi:hypothetical protein